MSDTHPERDLWAAVIVQAITDMSHTGHMADGCSTVMLRRQAQDWIGTYPRREFREVCDLAGLDADDLHARMKEMTGWSNDRLKEALGARK